MKQMIWIFAKINRFKSVLWPLEYYFQLKFCDLVRMSSKVATMTVHNNERVQHFGGRYTRPAKLFSILAIQIVIVWLMGGLPHKP